MSDGGSSMACVTLTGGVGSGGMLATGGRPMQSLTGSLEKATLFQTPLPPLNRQKMCSVLRPTHAIVPACRSRSNFTSSSSRDSHHPRKENLHHVRWSMGQLDVKSSSNRWQAKCNTLMFNSQQLTRKILFISTQ